MTPLSSRQRTVLRDAAVSVALLGLAMGLYRFYVEPAVLRIPGMVLYVPLLIVYVVLGGETENAMGPSPLLIAAYVVVLGVAVAAIADLVRRREWV